MLRLPSRTNNYSHHFVFNTSQAPSRSRGNAVAATIGQKDFEFQLEQPSLRPERGSRNQIPWTARLNPVTRRWIWRAANLGRSRPLGGQSRLKAGCGQYCPPSKSKLMSAASAQTPPGAPSGAFAGTRHRPRESRRRRQWQKHQCRSGYSSHKPRLNGQLPAQDTRCPVPQPAAGECVGANAWPHSGPCSFQLATHGLPEDDCRRFVLRVLSSYPRQAGIVPDHDPTVIRRTGEFFVVDPVPADVVQAPLAPPAIAILAALGAGTSERHNP
jgi:hypothetical protein